MEQGSGLHAYLDLKWYTCRNPLRCFHWKASERGSLDI
jgi:hypothetical protein